MIFDEADNPEQLRSGMISLLEEAQKTYGISMQYTKEPDGEEYLDWTVAYGHSHESAIIWMHTEHRHHWLFYYHKMLWHRTQEFFCTDE